MPFTDAIKIRPKDVIIELEVTPGSKHTIIPSGYNSWRRRIEVKISEKAQKGKANEQLVDALSKFLQISASQIKIINGLKSTHKSVLIESNEIDKLIDAFRKHF